MVNGIIQHITKEIKINFADKKIEAILDSEVVRRVHSSIETIAKRLNENKK